MMSVLAGLALGGALKGGADLIKGALSNHYAEKRARDQANLDYMYAQRYAENSPSWNVAGLRAAGLNPILAASGGFSAPNWKPSSPASPDTNSGVGLDSFDSMLTNRQNRLTSDSQVGVNKSQSALNDANVELAKANTAVKLLEAQQVKNDLKGKGYKNSIVNDVVRGMSDTAEALKNTSNNSPTSKDTRSSYISVSPDSTDYNKHSFFGRIQSEIDADNEVKKITGMSIRQVKKMPYSEKIKILNEDKKKKSKSRGYHIFTR